MLGFYLQLITLVQLYANFTFKQTTKASESLTMTQKHLRYLNIKKERKNNRNRTNHIHVGWDLLVCTDDETLTCCM